ncbi:unnamed protein product [Haemonchus placei]|uniref:DUF2405 domain-containing protein n=1 Tax=Haemonchus placei TaxID=6290 RepID=A0A0N4W9D5_HAEPC|nr:unnamed protein product [Haemonchus placei]
MGVIAYCGLYISRGHLVLHDVSPGCIFHFNIDELLMETFRSRDGWQVETSCLITRAKAIHHQPTNAPPLFDFGLQFSLSVDIAGSRLKTVGFRVADLTVELSSARGEKSSRNTTLKPERGAAQILASELVLGHISKKQADVFHELNQKADYFKLSSNEVGNPAAPGGSAFFSAEHLSDLHIETNNCLLKYRTVLGGERRASWGYQWKISVNGWLSGQKQNAGNAVQIISDSVQTSLSVQDVAWWKAHIDSVLPVLNKEERMLEIGVDRLCVAGPSVAIMDATFDRHQWGQSVYIGAALVQQNLKEPGLLIGIDDCKIEWSDKLAKQLKKMETAFFANSAGSRTTSTSRRTLNARLQLKRAALFSLAEETSFIAWLCDELAAESVNLCDFVASAQKTRLVFGEVRGTFIDISTLYSVEKFVPPQSEEELSTPWRCWSQSDNDVRKNRRRTAIGEKNMNELQLCGETNMLCISVEMSSSVRNVTCSSGAHFYLLWSPLLHRVVYHMIQVVKRTFIESPAGTAVPRKAPKPTQLRMLTNHSIEFVMELPQYHRMVWLIPSLTFDCSPAGLTAVSPQLTINMNGADIVTAIDVYITRRPFDIQMDNFRRGFDNCTTPSNKVWTWTAASFLFYLPYEFNFAQVFDEFINSIKWIKLVHGLTSMPFKPGGPLPADFRLVFKVVRKASIPDSKQLRTEIFQEARIELEDDFFENLLQMSHELKEDEVFSGNLHKTVAKLFVFDFPFREA